MRGTDSWNFETLKYNISNKSNDILLDNAYDPDLFFSARKLKIQTRCMSYLRISLILWKNQQEVIFQFSTLIFKASRKILKVSKLFCLPQIISLVLCFSETWCDDLDNSTYDLASYTSSHQKRSDRKGWGVSVYIYNSLNFKTRPDLSITCRDIESLTLEIIFEKTHNTIVSVLYRPPNGHSEYFENFLTNIFFNKKL